MIEIPRIALFTSLIDDKPVARIESLISDENLVNVVGVCRAACKRIANHLEYVLLSGRVVNVHINNAIIAVHEKGKL